jgi:hypothetical protein
VYVVTVPPPAHLGVLTPWPRIVSASTVIHIQKGQVHLVR